MTTDKNYQISSVEENLQKFDQIHNDIESKRKILIDNVMNIIAKASDCNNPIDRDDLEGRMSVFNSAGKLLNDAESAAKNRVTISYKNKELELHKNTGVAIAELLKNIKVNMFTDESDEYHSSKPTNLADIEDSFEKSGIKILDGELETHATK
jgi:hypothetical protein